MKKALVVVDMQNDFVTGALGTTEAAGIVDLIRHFAESFDGSVYFTMDTHGEGYLDTQEGQRLPVEHCIEGTDGWKIVPGLADLAELADTAISGSRVVKKNMFGSLDLAHMLAAGKYDEIHFAGVCTGICVISNAILAKTVLPGARIVIHGDLCACTTPESHHIALEAMKLLQMDVI